MERQERVTPTLLYNHNRGTPRSLNVHNGEARKDNNYTVIMCGPVWGSSIA